MGDYQGYRSAELGPQELKGPAVEALRQSTEDNRGKPLDYKRWLKALENCRETVNKVHDDFFHD